MDKNIEKRFFFFASYNIGLVADFEWISCWSILIVCVCSHWFNKFDFGYGLFSVDVRRF